MVFVLHTEVITVGLYSSGSSLEAVGLKELAFGKEV